MKKAFPIEIVLSLTTGRLLKDRGFSEMHELAEYVVGHPIWTHEFADKELFTVLQEAVLAQHPALRDAEEFVVPKSKPAVLKYLDDYVARARAKFGATLDIEAGSEERKESPLESAQRIMPGKPIVGVVVDDKGRSS